MSLPPGLAILLVDDSRAQRMAMRRLLERQRVATHVEEAGTVAEALYKAEAVTFDMMVLDVELPDGSGLTLLQELRESGQEGFAVIVTARADDQRMEAARRSGAYELLVKPFGPEEITKMVETAVKARRLYRVLLADDSRAIRTVVKSVLGKTKIRMLIEEADDGAEAWKSYNSQAHDIVFLDVYMPGLDGLDTLSRIKARNPRAKVIMLSATASDNDVARARAFGADAFLFKPFTAAEAEHVLQRVLGFTASKLRAKPGGVQS
ncbi:MAG: hypothetical protein OHK0024_16910 [Thalassobaculales bacterium]